MYTIVNAKAFQAFPCVDFQENDWHQSRTPLLRLLLTMALRNARRLTTTSLSRSLSIIPIRASLRRRRAREKEKTSPKGEKRLGASQTER